MAEIRLATEADAEQVQSIYAPIVRDTVISFEVEPPPVEEMRKRIATISSQHPWLVCDQRGEILGYAYAGRHRERAAYQWSVDVTIYIREGCRRAGIGRGLYTSLLQI